MMTRHWIKAALGVAALLVSSTSVNAAFIYSTTVAVANDPALPAPPPGAVNTTWNIGNGNTLQFVGNSIDASTPADPTAPGGADINFGTIKFNPSTTNSTTTNFNINYLFEVTVTDLVTNVSKIFDVTGNLNGVASGDSGNGASISSFVVSNGVSPTMLGFGAGGVFAITDKGGVGPGSSGTTITDGTLQANLQAVPEPSSVALMAIGGLAFGLVARRRMAKRIAE